MLHADIPVGRSLRAVEPPAHVGRPRARRAAQRDVRMHSLLRVQAEVGLNLRPRAHPCVACGDPARC